MSYPFARSAFVSSFVVDDDFFKDVFSRPSLQSSLVVHNKYVISVSGCSPSRPLWYPKIRLTNISAEHVFGNLAQPDGFIDR